MVEKSFELFSWPAARMDVAALRRFCHSCDRGLGEEATGAADAIFKEVLQPGETDLNLQAFGVAVRLLVERRSARASSVMTVRAQ